MKKGDAMVPEHGGQTSNSEPVTSQDSPLPVLVGPKRETVVEMMMMTQVTEQKRRNELTCEGGGSGSPCSAASKRPKTGCGSGGGGGGSNSMREKKDKVGERVAALQQMVCPFGKTDTASVLQEATEYIKFLQDQLQVLSAPYLRSTPPMGMLQEADYYSLRSRGLCLMPIDCTLRIAHSNGADIWAPNNTSNPHKF